MGQDELSIEAPERYRLTVADFLALDSTGVFAEKGRFELIDGEVYQMSPLYVPHARTVLRIGTQIANLIDADGLSIEVLSPVSVQLGENSLPEPDLVLAKGPLPATFIEGGAVLLAVEVAQSSLAYDLETKAALYAANGIAEYWVVDLPNRRLHQMTGPTPNGYATVEVHPFGTTVTSKTLPKIMVDTSRIA